MASDTAIITWYLLTFPLPIVAWLAAPTHWLTESKARFFLFLRGSGEDGQLGIGTNDDKERVCVVTALDSQSVRSVVAGSRNSLAICEDGKVGPSPFICFCILLFVFHLVSVTWKFGAFFVFVFWCVCELGTSCLHGVGIREGLWGTPRRPKLRTFRARLKLLPMSKSFR